MKTKIDRTYILLLLIVIIFSLAVIPISYTHTSNLGAIYLKQAVQLLEGKGFAIHRNRPPGFPLMIAGVFKLFGVSIQNAHYLVRVFSALNIIMVFLLASELFGAGVGLMGSLFVILSYPINSASVHINLDLVIPVFILLAILFFAKELRHHKLVYSIFSGISLGIAYLVKEIALLYLLLPLLIIFLGRKVGFQYILKSIFLFYISFFVIVSPWIAYVLREGRDFSTLLGHASPKILYGLYKHTNPIAFIMNASFFKNLFSYWKVYLKPSFGLAFLMIISWFYIFLVSIFRRRKDTLILLAAGMMFLPLLVYLGDKGDRLGHSITFFDLSFIALSYFITSISYQISYNTKWFKLHPKKNFVFIGLCITLFTFAAGYSLIKEKMFIVVAKKIPYIFGKFEVRGRHNVFVQEACQWINENVPKDEVIYIDGEEPTFDFFTHLNYQKKGIPSYGVTYYLSIGEEDNRTQKQDQVVAIFANPKFNLPSYGRDLGRYRSVEAFFKSDVSGILEIVKEHYLFLSKRNNYIAYYLEMAGGILRYENDEVKIYKGVKNVPETHHELPLLASDSFAEIIPWLKESYPEDYGRLEYFLNKYNLTFDTLIKNTYQEYQQKWVLENIPKDSKIAFCGDKDKFILEGGYNVDFFNNEKPLSYFSNKYDFLFISLINSRQRLTAFSKLFKDMEGEKPLICFPAILYLGDGWKAYRLDKDSSSSKGIF